MEQVSFSLLDYKFDKVNFDLSKIKSEKLSLDIRPSGVYEEKKSLFHLKFLFCSKSKGSEEDFIKVQCLADFYFQNVASREDIPDFFYSNCIAIIFPYIRAFVSTITLQANMNPVVLPIMNLVSLKEELQSHVEYK